MVNHNSSNLGSHFESLFFDFNSTRCHFGWLYFDSSNSGCQLGGFDSSSSQNATLSFCTLILLVLDASFG